MIFCITPEGNICAHNQDGTDPIIYKCYEIYPFRIVQDTACMSNFQLYRIVVTDAGTISITPILLNDDANYKVNPNNFSYSFAIIDNCCYLIDTQTNALVPASNVKRFNSNHQVKINVSNVANIKLLTDNYDDTKKRFLFVDPDECVWLVCPWQGQIKITDRIQSDYKNIFYECDDNKIIVYFFCSSVIVMQIFVKNLDTYVKKSEYVTQLDFIVEKAFECNCPNNFRIISTEGNVYRCKNVSNRLTISTKFKISKINGFDSKIIEANITDQIVYVDENHTVYEETGRKKIGTGFFTANIGNNTKSARFY
jgi:hypothetical protein